MTGHCLGAAGVIEAIACIMSVQNDIVPPTINHFTDDPELDATSEFYFLKGATPNSAMLRLVTLLVLADTMPA